MSFLLDILFPKKCVGCKKEGSYLCQDCIYKFMQRDLICPKCEQPAIGGQTHPICQSKLGLDGLWSLGAYQGPLKSVIKSLKYKFISQLADILVNITIDYWERHEPLLLEKIKKRTIWVVTSVPLYWYRENKRGFNQSSLIGKLFAAKLGLEYKDILKRIRNTKSQVKLTGQDRHQNIKNAFEITENCELKTKNCLLIDDVWTTGSTLRECCYVLKKAGAKFVWAITLAR